MAAVGEQSCLETFGGVVQVPPGDNRYWKQVIALIALNYSLFVPNGTFFLTDGT